MNNFRIPVKGSKARLVAKNPVARALAMRTLSEAATDGKLRLFLLNEGEQDREFIVTTARFFSVVLVACGMDKLHSRTDYNFKEVMDHIELALNHLAVMSQNQFRWQCIKAPDISDAIEACVSLTPKLSPEAINHGWHAVEHVK